MPQYTHSVVHATELHTQPPIPMGVWNYTIPVVAISPSQTALLNAGYMGGYEVPALFSNDAGRLHVVRWEM